MPLKEDGVIVRGFGLSVSVDFKIDCLFLLMIAANRFSAGSDSSGTVLKLASDVLVLADGSGFKFGGSDSIDSGVGVHDSVVAGVLHKCLKLNVSKGRCLIVGSPPMQLQLSGSCSSSELSGERNVLPRRVVMFWFSGFLRPVMEQGFEAARLVLRLQR